MEGLRVLHAPPGEAMRDVAPSQLGDALAADGWVWVDVVSRDMSELGDVPELLGLHPLDVEDIVHDDELPKFEHREAYVFLIAHIPGLDEERLRTVEIDIAYGPKFVATFRREASPGIDMVIDSIRQDPPSAAGAAFAALVDIVARRTLPLLDGLDAEIDYLEERGLAGHPAVPVDVQALRRDVIRLRAVLARQRDAHRLLVRELRPDFPPREANRLVSAQDDYVLAVEILETARSLLVSVLDTYRATTAERLNEVMKVLTVFSAILLPLSLIAGIFGMNFVNMPELKWQWGYFAALGLMAAIAVGLWLYFSRRGFIGGPRVPRVDRVVGRGLASFVHLTLAPIRGVHHLVASPGAKRGRGNRGSQP